jgi:hypothetical protein
VGAEPAGTAPGAAGQARAGADASDKLPSAMRLEMVTMLPAILIIPAKELISDAELASDLRNRSARQMLNFRH